MYRGLRAFTAAALVASAFGIVPSFAQKSGGILRVHAIDSPPSLSMHEEIDAVPARATMVIFNNLVMFDQHVKQNSIKSVGLVRARARQAKAKYPSRSGSQLTRWWRKRTSHQ